MQFCMALQYFVKNKADVIVVEVCNKYKLYNSNRIFSHGWKKGSHKCSKP